MIRISRPSRLPGGFVMREVLKDERAVGVIVTRCDLEGKIVGCRTPVDVTVCGVHRRRWCVSKAKSLAMRLAEAA